MLVGNICGVGPIDVNVGHTRAEKFSASGGGVGHRSLTAYIDVSLFVNLHSRRIYPENNVKKINTFCNIDRYIVSVRDGLRIRTVRIVAQF